MTAVQVSDRVRTPVLSALLVIVALGVFTQAILAGVFISETTPIKFVHLVVGSVLPVFAIVPAVVAWVRAAQGAVTKGFAGLTTLLVVALWVQEALGHVSFPVTTAVHVPLGVLLFAGSTALAVLSICRGRAER